MTQDEIIEMASRAGVINTRIDGLEAFAKLVAAKEHEWLIGYIRTHQPSCEQMANAIRARGQQ